MVLVALAMVFGSLLLMANILATKLISLGGWIIPGGFIVYPLTFLLTDIINEVYGRQTASKVVWLGFMVNVLAVLFIWIGGLLPAPDFWGGEAAYDMILGATPRIVAASMAAYLLSQHSDVFAFHFWRKQTRGRHLWFRNNASTMMSQTIDTLIFITIAFYGTVPANVLWNMIVTQYVVKLIVAAIDTPLLYILVRLVSDKQTKEYRESELATKNP